MFLICWKVINPLLLVIIENELIPEFPQNLNLLSNLAGVNSESCTIQRSICVFRSSIFFQMVSGTVTHGGNSFKYLFRRFMSPPKEGFCSAVFHLAS